MRTRTKAGWWSSTLLLAWLPAQTVPAESPVPQLRQLLHSGDAKVRHAAAERLGDTFDGMEGLPGHAAVPELLDVFANDEDARVAEMAALTLAKIGSWPLGAFEHVEAKLADWARAGAPPATIEALRAVLQQPAKAWPGSAIVPHLAELLHVPGCANDALGVLAMLGEDAAPATAAIDTQLIGADVGVRWRAAFALSCAKAAEAPSLRASLDDEDATVRFWSQRAQRSRGALPPASAKDLLPWLDDDRTSVRLFAHGMTTALESQAARAAPRLAEQLTEMACAASALAALQRLGPAAAAAVPTLTALLDSQNDGIRERAKLALGAIGPAASSAAERLLQIATAPVSTDPVMAQHLENEALSAVTALAKIVPERAVAALLPGFEAATESEAPGQWPLVTRFAFLGSAAASQLPRLRELLVADEHKGKLRALVVIEAIGEAAAEALPDVLPALATGDAFLRWMAVRAVVAMGPAAAAAVPALEAQYTNKDAKRADLIRDLYRLGDAAEPLLLRALSDETVHIRRSAAEQLLRLPHVSAEAQAAVLRHLDDDDASVRQEVCVRLANKPELLHESRVQAQRLLGSSDPHLRLACVTCLWNTYARKVERPRWQPYWTANLDSLLWQWGLAARTAAEMETFRDAEHAETWVLSFIGHEQGHVRAIATDLLGQLPSSKASLAALRTLAADGNAVVRSTAIMALGWQGAHARVALTDLAAALRDPDWTVRAAAAIALRAVHRTP